MRHDVLGANSAYGPWILPDEFAFGLPLAAWTLLPFMTGKTRTQQTIFLDDGVQIGLDEH